MYLPDLWESAQPDQDLHADRQACRRGASWRIEVHTLPLHQRTHLCGEGAWSGVQSLCDLREMRRHDSQVDPIEGVESGQLFAQRRRREDLRVPMLRLHLHLDHHDTHVGACK